MDTSRRQTVANSIPTGLPGLPTIADDDAKWFDIAASFRSGPWAVSGGYMYVQHDDPNDIGLAQVPQEMDAFSLTAVYNVAPGLAIMGGITVWDIENSGPGPVDNSATSFTLATQMSF